MKKNSLGNDIVSLLNTNASRAGNPQFYSKFLDTSEIFLFEKISGQIYFYEFVWLCWSIKESVYKFQKRLQPQLSFAAGKINIQEINPPLKEHQLLWKNCKTEYRGLAYGSCYKSIAVVDETCYYSFSIVTKAFIHTITCFKEDYSNIFWAIKKIENSAYDNQHHEVHLLIKEKLKVILPVEVPVIEKASEGIPYLQQYPEIPVSFSHHEYFVAYAFSVDKIFLQSANRLQVLAERSSIFE